MGRHSDPDREPVEVIFLAKKAETPGAILYVLPHETQKFADGRPKPGREVWIPKSQIQDEDELDDGIVVTLPSWLADREELH